MGTNTSDRTYGDIMPVFERNNFATIAATLIAFGVTLFSVYLMVCIVGMKVNTRNSYIKAILNLAVIDTTVGVALICRMIFEFLWKAEQTYVNCALWSYIFVTLQSISYFHTLAIGIYRYTTNFATRKNHIIIIWFLYKNFYIILVKKGSRVWII